MSDIERVLQTRRLHPSFEGRELLLNFTFIYISSTITQSSVKNIIDISITYSSLHPITVGGANQT